MKTIQEVMDSSINILETSVRIENAMKNVGAKTLKDVTSMNAEDFLRIRNFGKTSYQLLKDKLASIGLFIGMTDQDWLQWGITHIDWIKCH